MIDIQAVLVANLNDVTIAFRDWSESPDDNGGVFDLTHPDTASLVPGLDAMGAEVRIVGDLNTANDRNPRLAILKVDVDGVLHRIAARGFSIWGSYNSKVAKCWAVFGMTGDQLQSLRAAPSNAGDNIADIAAEHLAEATSAILYGKGDDISNSGGATSAVDASSAVDGGN